MRQHTALVWLAASMIHASAAVAGAQPPTSSGSSGFSSSYVYLSRDAVRLVDQYLVSKGLPRGPAGYEMLSGTQRTTFESIVHALESQGHLGIVDRVTEIWGGRIGARGVDQFRLSVLLVPGAVGSLISHRDYKMSVFGHVKLPSGDVIGARGADSVRQRGRRPTLQISWLEDDVTVGEIDIDYRENGEGHLRPPNSDIRGRIDGGETHYDRHVERFRHLPEWWRMP